ncbi:MAG TPA: hypothetical protein VGB75_05690 [Jatrophihabitans sp.]|jgi:hypothetical protein|uniref:hypothetical protein n=1 Tax=Jatrophihabitans sp. TaxID=1932789 RepID=UPI002F0E37EF
MTSPDKIVSSSEEIRAESHNSQINTAAAQAHRCGMTHLATGRICLLPERHPGSCDFQQRQNDVSPDDSDS